jgi:hypothetical protein
MIGCIACMKWVARKFCYSFCPLNCWVKCVISRSMEWVHLRISDMLVQNELDNSNLRSKEFSLVLSEWLVRIVITWDICECCWYFHDFFWLFMLRNLRNPTFFIHAMYFELLASWCSGLDISLVMHKKSHDCIHLLWKNGEWYLQFVVLLDGCSNKG